MSAPTVLIGPKELLPEPRVECDADLWRAIAEGRPVIVAQDSSLSSWIRNVALARGWPVQLVEDPRVALAKSFPALAPYASELVSLESPTSIRPLWRLLRQSAPTIPDAAEPSTRHAEAVGRWRIGHRLTEAQSALLREAALELSGQEDRERYSLVTSSPIDLLLEHLVGERQPTFETDYELQKEPWLSLPIERWVLARLAVNSFDGLRQALLSRAPKSSKMAIARSVVRVAKDVDLPPDTLAVLSPYLDEFEKVKLRALVPPAEPGEVPGDPAKLSDWFQFEYRPYREWMHAKGIPSDGIADAIWTNFADVYLQTFAKAVGSGQGELALHRSRKLRQSEQPALLVVLDGPLPWDIDQLIREVHRHAPDWSVVASDWVLASVPTVTEICRPSVVCGVVATSATKDDAVTSMAKARAAFDEGSEFVVVKYEQPDKAYHALGEPPERLRLLARHSINLMAEEIAGLLSASNCSAVYVTADHGRCMGPSDPTLSAPSGRIHGRTVLGVHRGTEHTPGVRILNGDLLGFSASDDAGVALGANCFKGTGHVWYTHGGLLPEEAFVPWIEMRRVPATVHIQAKAFLEGAMNQPGQVRVRISNLSTIQLRIESLKWTVQNHSDGISFGGQVVPSANERELVAALPTMLENYPSAAELSVSTPDGTLHVVTVELEAKVRKMQSQNIDLLEDL